LLLILRQQTVSCFSMTPDFLPQTHNSLTLIFYHLDNQPNQSHYSHPPQGVHSLQTTTPFPEFPSIISRFCALYQDAHSLVHACICSPHPRHM
jgi:hypothetical protein